MYNLFVSANEKDWNGNPFILELDRSVHEYTDPKITEKYGELEQSSINEIMRFPCIFAYEAICKKDPKFGLICEIVKRQGKVKISYEIIKLDKFLTHSDIKEMLFNLDIDHREINRTHWAIKNVNLPKELSGRGIKLPTTDIRTMEETSKRKNNNYKQRKNKKGRGKTIIKINDSQIHFGKGNNIKESKISTKQKGKLLHDPYFIIKIIGLLIALISIPWLPQIIQKIKTPENKIQQRPSSSPQFNDLSINKKNGLLRALEPLETGKKISELPNGVYFFSTPVGIEYEIENIGVDFIKVSGFSNDYKFEIQKFESRYYLVGFVSDEVHSRLAGVSSVSPLDIILYPNKWGGATHPIAIPFDAIISIDYRDIELDAKTEITVFDIKMKEVSDNPEVHK